MSNSHCANCAKKSKQDPKYLVIPANFHPEDWDVPAMDVGLLRSIVHLDTTMEHSMARYDLDNHPDPFDDTYKSVRMTRERIENQIKENPNSYNVVNFGKISGLVRADQEEIVRAIIMEVRDDFYAEERFFGRKIGFHDTVMYSKNDVSHNCWIFLREHEMRVTPKRKLVRSNYKNLDFLLFTSENADKIKDFFLNNQQN